MEGVKILLVVMACSGDLLTCEDVSRELEFTDMRACEAKRLEVIARPGVIDAGRPALMARCHYATEEYAQASDDMLRLRQDG